MQEAQEAIFAAIGWMNKQFLWSPWTFYLLLGMGILFTIWTRFCQYGALTHGFRVVRGVYDNPDDPGAINHFQALSAALSATVGLGNIGGVALAISAGGPGALFWMWIIGFLGMALKTIEITLAMLYRNTDDPENPHGGAMWVIDKTLGTRGGICWVLAKMLGGFFCVTLLISCMTGGNMFQSWNVAELTKNYFDVPRVVTGIVLAILVGMVIVGGIKRIGNVASRLVPFMCILYLLSALAVLAMHVNEIPSLLFLIVKSAFMPTEAQGAFLGGTIGIVFAQGLRRALFSNEAGQGSAPIAHAAAKTNEPAREGIVGGIGPFIDTLCICTLTALVILVTNTWNREGLGDLQGGFELVRLTTDESSEKNTWTVKGPTNLENLPKNFGDESWREGSQFYLVARLVDSGTEESITNRVKVTATIVSSSNEKDTDSPRGGDPYISWHNIQLDSKESTTLELVDRTVYREFTGAPLTALAFDREFPGLGKWLVTFAAWLFAFSTMISWSYYGEQGTIYLFGQKGVLPYKLVFLVLTAIAPIAVQTDVQLGDLIDFGTGWMLWANLPIVLLMGHLAVRSLKDYYRRLHAGEFRKS